MAHKPKRPKPFGLDLQLGYKDSNLEMTESESVTVTFPQVLSVLKRP